MYFRWLFLFGLAGLGESNQCGLPYISPNTNNWKIVGGSDAVKGSWPWQVRLGYRKSSWFGTSIDFDSDVKKYMVTAGDWDRSVIEGNERNYEVKRIIIHPNYDPATTDNDIALLEIEGEIEFNREVWPICLPPEGSDPAVGTKCFATGWGDTEASEWKSARSGRLAKGQSLVLQQVAVVTLSRSICWNNYYPGLISNTMICAGYPEGGRDPCKADSGGPLACLNRNGGYDLVGIISWGHGCGWPKQPGVYARVGSFTAWINQNSQL